MYPYILTFLAGFATLLGCLPIFVKIKNENKIISASCAFASGVMASLSIFDLVPTSFSYLCYSFSGFLLVFVIFSIILLGIIVSLFLEHFINGKDNMLYKIGILSMVALILHNIPEGIVTFILSSKSIMLGIPISLAIAIHNIPEGISIAIPIYYATRSKFKAIIYTLISAFSELLGAIMTSIFLNKYISDIVLGIIFAFTAGLMIAISLDKLLPTSYSYNRKLSLLYFIIGFIFMVISLQLNNLIF